MKLKNRMKSLLLVAAVFAVSLSASAKGKIAIVPYLKTNYTLISAEPREGSYYTVVISNRMGETVYSASSRIKDEFAFSKLFDFSKLEDGEYKVRLMSRKGGSFEETFHLKGGVLTSKASDNAEVTEKDVKIWKKEDLLFVSHLNRNMNDLSVKIEDERGSVLFDSVLPSELTYSGKFNVASLPKGSYVMSFVSGNKVFNYEFRK